MKQLIAKFLAVALVATLIPFAAVAQDGDVPTELDGADADSPFDKLSSGGAETVVPVASELADGNGSFSAP